MTPISPIISGKSTMSRSLQNAFNYHQWQYELIKPYLGKKVLECGCGPGYITKLLATKKNLLVYAVDIDPSCIININKLNNFKNIIPKRCDLRSSLLINKYKHKNIDTILLLNVFEHIKEDLKLLKNLGLILRQNGKLLIFVPAFKALYGGMDKSAGHFRRYTLKSLKNKLLNSNFQIIKMEYVNPLGFFGWWFTNKVLKLNDLNHSIINRQITIFNKFLIKLSNDIQPLTKYCFGQSIFTVVQKK